MSKLAKTVGEKVVLIVVFLALPSLPLWGADTTPPTRPTVTDDGVYTSSATQLHATWTSTDPESGIADYQYLIRQNSTSGTIIVPWTSTGSSPVITRTALSLLQGNTYYIGVKAKNSVGLWSQIGYSNGMKVDTTPPIPPGQPIEGSSRVDADYDADGNYTIFWTAPNDPESGISTYELQEQVGSSGVWTTLTNTLTNPRFTVSGRMDNTRYSYRVRAQNGAGLWGNWSPSSDGILVDKTAPSPVTVTDDGLTTASTTQLHATWTASNDPASGIVDYQYLIRQDSSAGSMIVNWTSVGLATEVTQTGLSLLTGKTYYVGVRAKNGAGLDSSPAYSNGITVQADTIPPTIEAVFPAPNPSLYAGDPLTISAQVTDTDPSPLEYQFTIDGNIKQAWSSATTYRWSTTTSMAGAHWFLVEVRDGGGSSSHSQSIYLYLKPPGPP